MTVFVNIPTGTHSCSSYFRYSFIIIKILTMSKQFDGISPLGSMSDTFRLTGLEAAEQLGLIPVSPEFQIDGVNGHYFQFTSRFSRSLFRRRVWTLFIKSTGPVALKLKCETQQVVGTDAVPKSPKTTTISHVGPQNDGVKIFRCFLKDNDTLSVRIKMSIFGVGLTKSVQQTCEAVSSLEWSLRARSLQGLGGLEMAEALGVGLVSPDIQINGNSFHLKSQFSRSFFRHRRLFSVFIKSNGSEPLNLDCKAWIVGADGVPKTTTTFCHLGMDNDGGVKIFGCHLRGHDELTVQIKIFIMRVTSSESDQMSIFGVRLFKSVQQTCEAVSSLECSLHLGSDLF